MKNVTAAAPLRPDGSREAGRSRPEMRRRWSAAVARAVFLSVIGVAVVWGGGAPARAQVTLQLSPSVGAGITNNAAGASAPGLRESDEFGTVNLGLGLNYQRALSRHSLTFSFGYTHYLQNLGPDSVSDALAWQSSFNLTGALDLRVAATASLARISRVDVTDPTLVMPQALAQGSTYALGTGVNEGLTYRANGKRTYTQSLGVSQVYYVEAAAPMPTSTNFAAQVRGSQLVRNDTVFLEAIAGDTYTAPDPSIQQTPFTEGNVIIAQINVGWQHVISAAWAAQVQAGPVATFKPAGPGVIAPGFAIVVSYRHLPWFATLTLAQTASPNLFIGQSTINDQAAARVALPLNRRETLFVSGVASYIYARIATEQGSLERAFDQRTAGVALTARLSRLPIGASLQYAYVDQHGNDTPGREVPDLQTQTATLNVGGYFSWGPGTPPLFGGGP